MIFFCSKPLLFPRRERTGHEYPINLFRMLEGWENVVVDVSWTLEDTPTTLILGVMGVHMQDWSSHALFTGVGPVTGDVAVGRVGLRRRRATRCGGSGRMLHGRL